MNHVLLGASSWLACFYGWGSSMPQNLGHDQQPVLFRGVLSPINSTTPRMTSPGRVNKCTAVFRRKSKLIFWLLTSAVSDQQHHSVVALESFEIQPNQSGSDADTSGSMRLSACHKNQQAVTGDSSVVMGINVTLQLAGWTLIIIPICLPAISRDQDPSWVSAPQSSWPNLH